MKQDHKNKLKAFGLLTISFVMILTFQNCSPQFQVADTLPGLNQATESSVLSPPAISFAAGSSVLFNSSQVEIDFNVAAPVGAILRSVQCQLNDQMAIPCESMSVSFSDLEDGDHSLRIIAETDQDSRSEVTRLFRVDTLSPVLTVSMMPSAVTNATTAQFQFITSDSLSGIAQVQCSLDNAAFANCSSPVSLASLAIGNHNFRIRAVDRAGNISDVYSYNWMINMALATPVFVSTPPTLTNSNSATFTFTGNGVVSFECQLDATAFTACTSPIVLNNLQAGARVFRVRGLDAGGLMSAPTQFMWVIDQTAPTLPNLMSSVGPVSNIRTATFTFSSTDAVGVVSYQCSLDNAAFANCTSPLNVANLVNGNHSFSVRALDGAGNVSMVASFLWSVNAPNEDEVNLAAGLVLYANNCAGCHGAVQNSNKRNRSALEIQASIQNVPVMMGIELTPLEIQQIARALSDN